MPVSMKAYCCGLLPHAGVAKAMLGAAVVRDKARPEWPTSSSYTKHHGLYPLDPPGGKDDFLQPPQAYRQLAEQCWAHEPHDRSAAGLAWVLVQHAPARELGVCLPASSNVLGVRVQGLLERRGRSGT